MDKLRVGILGMRRGVTHLHNFLHLDNAQVVAVADRAEGPRERVREQVEQAGGVVLTEYDDLLALKPDAVVVASNGRWQCRHAIQALHAGCAVFSEVPGAFTLDEWLALRDAVDRTDGFYMMAENACYWDAFRYLRRWVKEGRFGPVSHAEGEYVHYLPATLLSPDGGSIAPSAAKAEGQHDLKPTWRADQPPIQYLTHDLGPLLELLDDRVVSVTCRQAPFWSREAPLRSDGQYALLETAKGSLLRLLVTLNCPRPGDHRYRLFGTEGGAEWSILDDHVKRFSRGRQEHEGWEKIGIGLAAATDDTSTGHGGADLKTAWHFTQAILDGRPSPIDVNRAIDYSLPGILANQSAALGGAPLPVPELRHEPFAGTRFWDAIPLPEKDPVLGSDGAADWQE